MKPGGATRVIFRNLFYFIAEAWRGLFRNGWMSVASVGVVAVTLLILGIFVLLHINVGVWTESLKEQIEIVIFVNEDASGTDQRNLRNMLNRHDFVKDITFVSREEAFKRLQRDLGPILEGYDPSRNPLRDSYEIRTYEPEMAIELQAMIKDHPGVGDIRSDRDIIEKMTSFTRALQIAALSLMVLLAITATFLISHSIRMTVMLRSKEIMIMKYVGAADTFIRLPFLLEGMFLGALGTVLPLVGIYAGYYYLLDLALVAVPFLPMASLDMAFMGVVQFIIPLGMGLGILGSILSIGRYLQV